MSSPSQKLTKRVVDGAAPKEARYDLWDSELPGFGLRVEKSGTKTFIIRYRANGGGRTAPRRFMTVGRYPTLCMEDARKKAKELLGAAAKGDDPAGERSAKRKELTIAQLIDIYADEGTSHLKPLTRKYTLARLQHHIIPTLGTKKVTEVGPADVERMIRAVTNGKTAKDEKVGPRARVIVKGGRGAAAKVVRDLSGVFAFAKRHRIVAENPCESAKKPTDNKRETFLSLDELSKIGAALDTVAAEGANRMAVDIIRLLAFTACRRNEICGLRWSEVDFDHSCFRLADTKTGKSVRRLGAPALELLRTLPRHDGTDYVFPATSGSSHFQGLKRVWKRVRELAGMPTIMPHTLRHTFASEAVSNGETLPMTGALLGHANARTTDRYSHIAQDPAKQAADRVSRRIANAMAGNVSGNVVILKEKSAA
ncbi:site-specific integrase [Niveispirillum sp.]|uniref:site-specific integrase n=1 Tax=Niveispirillum sp. TaxID=1917217 RepID=UPI001B7733FA|nr:site-specific integrase [Niveispirillum sp.]MBP7340138.1 site-specific integrase [Niveispirillum sp.]